MGLLVNGVGLVIGDVFSEAPWDIYVTFFHGRDTKKVQVVIIDVFLQAKS